MLWKDVHSNLKNLNSCTEPRRLQPGAEMHLKGHLATLWPMDLWPGQKQHMAIRKVSRSDVSRLKIHPGSLSGLAKKLNLEVKCDEMKRHCLRNSACMGNDLKGCEDDCLSQAKLFQENRLHASVCLSAIPMTQILHHHCHSTLSSHGYMARSH